jgi:hypothetical protein
MRHRIHPSLPLLSLAAVLVAAPAWAQDIAAAEALFNRGLADMEAGRYEPACKAIAESQRLDPRPGTLFTLAVCEERWGHVATAVTRYGDYLALFDRLPEDRKASQGERPRVARAAREKLGPEVPELTLILPPDAPAGTVVKRDGQVVAEAALGVALPLDPGEHTVSTEAPGGPLWERKVTLARGEKTKLPLEVKAAAGTASKVPAERPAPPPPPVAAGPSRQRVAGFVVGGVGVVGLSLGGVLGGLALAQKKTVDQNCGASVGSKDPLACKQAGLDALGTGKGLALGSTIGFVAGASATVTGLVLVLADRGQAAPATTATGRWLSVGVLSLGRDGAAVGARGAW